MTEFGLVVVAYSVGFALPFAWALSLLIAFVVYCWEAVS